MTVAAPRPGSRNNIVQPFNLILCSLLLPFSTLMVLMEIPQKAFKVALVFG
jgi:hypothetical protein